MMTALFDRLKTGVPGLVNAFVQSATTPSLSLEKAALMARKHSSPYASISLDALVEEVGSLSKGSVLIGACDDRLHFYMDLFDPRPGSVLIASDQNAGQSRLLNAILSSAVLLNSYRYLRYAYLSDSPLHDSSYITRQPHCYRAISSTTPDVGQLIIQLADLAESRAHPARGETVMILAIHGLDNLCTRLDDRAYDDLAWLLQNGPIVRVWPFATLDVQRAGIVGANLLQLFGTRLLGAMDAKNAAIFQGDANITGHLISGKQFCVWFDDQWLSFWVPEPAEIQRASTN